jgi:uncharacterized lipoprotein YddW (UPF0748 family)
MSGFKKGFTLKKILVISSILTSILLADGQPKHEFRAAWVATAWALDFPQSNSSSSAMQTEISEALDALQEAEFNAVIFQVRPGCDAFYNSAYEPWSHHLTGTSGQAPAPYFDPLQTWIDEAHKRNMELHAWFNPYRVSTASNLNSLHSSHVYHQHPEWLLSVGAMAGIEQEDPFSDPMSGLRDLRETIILDPGKAVVREYVINVFMDVVNNYDVDGIHMDDYFYPYGGMSGEDSPTFAAEPRGFTNISAWRRDNVNLLVEGLYDSIQAVKPWVKSGVSPFGIWKNGVPAGIVGTSSYHDLYCDPVAWLEGEYVDYVTPQLYWAHGGGQDYSILMPWWAQTISNNNRHLYVGHAPYRLTDWHDWPANELPRQVRLNRATAGCQGSVYFRLSSGVLNNPKGFLDSLRNDLYQYPAIAPAMFWKDDVPPNPPASVSFGVDGQSNQLMWSLPESAPDGDLPNRMVIYRSESYPVDPMEPANIYAIVSSDSTSFTCEVGENYFYAMSALDRLHNESTVVQVASSHVEFSQKPDIHVLLANYPNPFNASTIIQYDLPENAQVSVSIFDMNGKPVRTLAATYSSSGDIRWDGTNDAGQSLSTGIYLCRLMAGVHHASIKLVLLK